jgi:hypothetical protein
MMGTCFTCGPLRKGPPFYFESKLSMTISNSAFGYITVAVMIQVIASTAKCPSLHRTTRLLVRSSRKYTDGLQSYPRHLHSMYTPCSRTVAVTHYGCC